MINTKFRVLIQSSYIPIKLLFFIGSGTSSQLVPRQAKDSMKGLIGYQATYLTR